MSVLLKINNCVFVDHCSYISQLYTNVNVNVDLIKSYCMSQIIFTVKRHEKKSSSRKRTREDCDRNIIEETALVKHLYEDSVKCLVDSDLKNYITNVDTDNLSVREFSKKIFESTIFDHNGIRGGNNSENSIRCTVQNELFLIPPKSKFLCGCIQEQCKKLIGHKFDVVVADPPWWNKYIRRLKNANSKLSYSMMYNEDIADIPVKELVADNCLVAVWCTNSPSNIAAVKNLIFPKWGVNYQATWYWLKITVDFKPLCEFGTGSKKQPYERLIIGKVGDIKYIPENQLIISVPSALHSHKPPLTEILQPYLKVDNPQTLELFARYLLPNTTSVGYEPLKWQHLSLYETIK